MKIKWLKRAFQNLESIANYLQQNNPEIAIQIVLKIQTGIEKLADFPLMGRKGRVASTRELVIINTPYVVIYRIKNDNVEILRILHSAQKFPP
jgi:toxin ParE1/3/4